MIARRDFIHTMAGITAGLMLPYKGFSQSTSNDKWGNLLPLRKLGNTGESVTMLGVGGYHVGWTTEKDAQEVIEAAIEGGIRFFDTAESYASGESERRYGKYLVPKYRDQVFLMSKTTAPTAETALRHLEETLKRLNTDHLDLWQVHALQSPSDVDNRIANGIIEAMRKAKESGKARFVGFTGHQSPYAHLRMLEKTGDQKLFDTCQFPVNLVDLASQHSFVQKVIPKIQEKGVAILAMKTLADGRFFKNKMMEGKQVWQTENPVVPNKVKMEEALYFTWTMPISVLITGAENAVLIKEKIALAHKFAQMSASEQETLANKLSEIATEGKVEYYKNIL